MPTASRTALEVLERSKKSLSRQPKKGTGGIKTLANIAKKSFFKKERNTEKAPQAGG